MTHLLWITACIPAAFIGVGLLIYLIGDELPPFEGIRPRQIVSGFLGLAAAGFFGTAMVCVVLGPALLLYYAAHLSYGISVGIGLPLGMVALVYLTRFIPKATAVPKTTDDKPEL